MFESTKTLRVLDYDPGRVPTRRAFRTGKRIRFGVKGLPPWRDQTMPVSARDHPAHTAFVELREAATLAMRKHAWTDRPVDIMVKLKAPKLPAGRAAIDFAWGLVEALAGSSDRAATYLPVIVQHKGLVRDLTVSTRKARHPRYVVRITFH